MDIDSSYILFIILFIAFLFWIFVMNARDKRRKEAEKEFFEKWTEANAQEQAKRISRQQAIERVETYLKGNFGVRITPCVKRSGNEFIMKHGTQYKIGLVNEYSVRANAAVFIDGKHVGTFRLPPNSKCSIEHPVNDNSRFTFYELESKEAKQFDLFEDNEKLGEITCVFVPEKEGAYNPDIRWKVDDTPSRGGTGLSGYSNQEYSDAEKIELDEDKKEEITVKLLCWNDTPHKLSAVKPRQDGLDSASTGELMYITIITVTTKEIIEKMILPSYESPTEVLYFLLSISRKILLKKGYPVRLVNLSQQTLLNILIKYNLKMNVLLSRDNFYRNIQQKDKDNFIQNVIDIIKTSQYYKYGDDIDLCQVQINSLKIITDYGFGILDEAKMRSTFLSVYRHFLEAFDDIIPDFKE